MDIQLILLDTCIQPADLQRAARDTVVYRSVSWPPTARRFPARGTLDFADARDCPEVIQELGAAGIWLEGSSRRSG